MCRRRSCRTLAAALAASVVYTNPWNEGRVHTIAITDLASQAAGTSADFEIVTF